MARGKAKLDGPQRAQVIEMIKTDKTPEEIIVFVKQTYGVDIGKQYVWNLKNKMGGGRYET